MDRASFKEKLLKFAGLVADKLPESKVPLWDGMLTFVNSTIEHVEKVNAEVKATVGQAAPIPTAECPLCLTPIKTDDKCVFTVHRGIVHQDCYDVNQRLANAGKKGN